jgi:hypothetical protein
MARPNVESKADGEVGTNTNLGRCIHNYIKIRPHRHRCGSLPCMDRALLAPEDSFAMNQSIAQAAPPSSLWNFKLRHYPASH